MRSDRAWRIARRKMTKLGEPIPSEAEKFLQKMNLPEECSKKEDLYWSYKLGKTQKDVNLYRKISRTNRNDTVNRLHLDYLV